MRRATIVLGGLVLGAGLLLAQPGLDPWWRPLNPGGGSYGVTVGTVLPSLASTGTNPAPGELAIDMNAAPDGGPLLYVWDHLNAEWDAYLTTDLAGALTLNYLIKTTATGFGDSTVTDDGLNVVATAGLVTAGAAVGGANSITVDGNNAAIVFEGVVNDFELSIMAENQSGDCIFNIPDFGFVVAAVEAFVSTGVTVPQAPGGVWAEDNTIVFEGATANLFENRLGTVDVAQTQAVLLPDLGQAAGSLAVSVIDAPLWDVGDAGAIWFDANTIWFEGTTADGNENRIISGDAGAGGATYQLPAAPSDSYALLVSYFEGNTPQAANAIWGNIGELVFEGTGANDFEIRIMADVVGVDSVIEFASPVAGASSNLMRILTNLTTVPMDNADTVNGLSIEITNANHAGAGNVLNGVSIADIVGDAQATEVGIRIGAAGATGWDQGILVPRGSATLPAIAWVGDPDTGFYNAADGNAFVVVNGGANTMQFGPRPAAGGSGSWIYGPGNAVLAMNGSDTVNILLIDQQNADHAGAGNYLNMIKIDAPSLEDAEAVEAGIFIGDGMDAHIIFDAMEAASAENPPAGSVMFNVDDNADYSGGGGNDCASYYRTSTGTVVLGTVIVLNGPCT